METQSTEIKDLATALAKAQAEIKPALKDSDNPFFKSKYADLASVQAACMPLLNKNGLSVTQAIQTVGESAYLVTTLLHSSGQWMRSTAPIKPVKNDPQSFGSAVTYMRRYSLASIAGVAQEDDDGNSAAAKNGDAKHFDMDLDRAQQEQIYDEALKKLAAADSIEKLAAVWAPYQKTIKKMPNDLAADLIQKKDECKAELQRQNGSAH